MPCLPRRHLPRLERHHYQGFAVVFWTLTIESRTRGWLSAEFHASFREALLHSAARYSVVCPAYCLMPDHLHLIWMGRRRNSDQHTAMRFLRTELEPRLGEGREWQHQAHDHVLRESERTKNAFAATCFYILENPVRAELVASSGEWGLSGAVIPGYPRMHPLDDGYWELFWRLDAIDREAEAP